MQPTIRLRPGVQGQRNNMPSYRPLFLRLPLLLAVSALLAGLFSAPLRLTTAAPPSQDTVLSVTYPSEGSTLSGEVAIMGTATTANFVSYGLLYATGDHVGGSTNWRQDDTIAWNVQTMIVNGVLGTWDTTRVPNGQYVLALVVYQAGSGEPFLHFVNNLTVHNEETTPTPEPTETPTGEEPGAADPTAESELPPPAATLQQPSTATPRPTPTLEPASSSEEEDTDDEGGLFSGDIFSVEAVKEAFVLGAQLAFLLYAIGILYVLAKAAVRYYLRQTQGKQSS